MKRIAFYILAALLLMLAGVSCTCSSAPAGGEAKIIRVGIAWRADSNKISNTATSIREAGAEPVFLGQVRPSGFEYDSLLLKSSCLDENEVLLQEYADLVKSNSWHGSNATEVLEGIDAVVFTGGEDIAPTLYRNPQPWHGIEVDKNFNATRDLSDYLTMAYCLDNDIPVLGLCRGMQVLSVVSGCDMIQDIPSYYASLGKVDGDIHRMRPTPGVKRRHVPHDVTVTTHESLLYGIVGRDTVTAVPSWHHQAAVMGDGLPLLVSGVTEVDGISIVEAIERTDKNFALGVQYHPEIAVAKHVKGAEDADVYMSYDDAILYFKALIEHVK